MPVSVFDAFDTAKKEIWLAILALSFDVNELASISLDIHCLQESPVQEGLSYTCGDPTIMMSIQ